MNESRPWPVIIVGAGPVGQCAALELARLGVECLLLERDAAPATELRASTFHPPTLDMLEPLGLTPSMLNDGLRVPQWQVRLHATHERAVFDLGVLGDDTGHPYRLQFGQAEFSALADARIRATSAITLAREVRVTGIEQRDDRVVLETEGPSGPERHAGRWIVAADGASSTLRGLLELPFEGLTYPETTILATTRFPFEAHLPGLSWVNYVWAPDGTFSLLRVPDRWRVSLYPRDGESVEAALEPGRIEARLQEIVANPDGYEILEVRPYRIHQRILASYRPGGGRVLFAGDAAHLNSPSGGMGMNCGIHDALNLAGKLARVVDGEEPALLDLYDRQRRPIARDEILRQADGNRRRMQTRDPAWRRAELERLQAITADRSAMRDYLLRSSMIAGLRTAAQIR